MDILKMPYEEYRQQIGNFYKFMPKLSMKLLEASLSSSMTMCNAQIDPLLAGTLSKNENGAKFKPSEIPEWRVTAALLIAKLLNMKKDEYIESYKRLAKLSDRSTNKEFADVLYEKWGSMLGMERSGGRKRKATATPKKKVAGKKKTPRIIEEDLEDSQFPTPLSSDGDDTDSENDE